MSTAIDRSTIVSHCPFSRRGWRRRPDCEELAPVGVRWSSTAILLTGLDGETGLLGFLVEPDPVLRYSRVLASMWQPCADVTHMDGVRRQGRRQAAELDTSVSRKVPENRPRQRLGAAFWASAPTPQHPYPPRAPWSRNTGVTSSLRWPCRRHPLSPHSRRPYREQLSSSRAYAASGQRIDFRSEGAARVELLEDRTTPALVAAYSFGEGSGPRSPLSGNGNAGTLSNTIWVAGKSGNGLKFSGAANSFVTVPDAPGLHLTNGMTLEAWVNPSSLNSIDSNWVAVVAKDYPISSFNDISYALYAGDRDFNAARRALPYVAAATSDGQPRPSTSKLKLNTWTFLAVASDGTNMKVYVNGTLVKTKAQTGTITETNAPLKIGGDSSGEMFTGIIMARCACLQRLADPESDPDRHDHPHRASR